MNDQRPTSSPARSSPVRAAGRETPSFYINQPPPTASAGSVVPSSESVLEHHPVSFILAEKEKQLKTLYQTLEQRLSERDAEVNI